MRPRSRAVSDEQKAERRSTILQTALTAFADTAYDELTMDRIAADAGLAKGTLYLYFRSKEEVFLALCEHELGRWFDDLDTALQTRRAEMSINGLVELFAASFAGRPRLLRLLAILHTGLEHNVPYAAALGFKTLLKSRTEATGALLESYLRFLEPGRGAALLIKIYALIIGFEHLSEPSGVVREVLSQPDMELFRVNLQPALLDTLKILLMGLAYEAKYRQA
ncbi:MAG: TetR family transcriptional regulator [Gammaproteobacteria bacterium]|nr:TetR/AcrR family transcriptional regulator [Gammaproteobacteria bacterium]MDE1887310.1 TetR family transcriptional regulator [Gammaproteobacteria bacterium]MDE2023312.1 TetR family transcriptional regulator [Gammaproteobacteria bacterium]MDE2274632.1 TetR family transcriptional regulator [Gammaproteobacteria bacterium]